MDTCPAQDTPQPAAAAPTPPAAPTQRPCDLHALTVRCGTRAVAETVGLTYRHMLDLRHGSRPLTVDHMYALLQRFPDFDAVATIRKIGQNRIDKGIDFNSRKATTAEELEP